MSVEDRQNVAERLISSGNFPPDGVEIVRWDGTPDGWGVLIADAESAQAMHNAINLWRSVNAGFFESTTTAPAQPIDQEFIEQQRELFQSLQG